MNRDAFLSINRYNTAFFVVWKITYSVINAIKRFLYIFPTNADYVKKLYFVVHIWRVSQEYNTTQVRLKCR